MSISLEGSGTWPIFPQFVMCFHTHKRQNISLNLKSSLQTQTFSPGKELPKSQFFAHYDTIQITFQDLNDFKSVYCYNCAIFQEPKALILIRVQIWISEQDVYGFMVKFESLKVEKLHACLIKSIGTWMQWCSLLMKLYPDKVCPSYTNLCALISFVYICR